MKPHDSHDEIQLLENLFQYIIPKYKEAHDIMVSMLDFEQTQEVRVADLGCGFGELTQRVMETFPLGVVFALDNQPRLLQRMREKFGDYSDQLVLFERDLNNNAWMHEMEHLNAIVSSFTLDYVTQERHKQIIKEAYGLLDKSGRWVSCEFFRSQDTRVNRVFHDLEMTFIQNAIRNGEVSMEQIDHLSQSFILRQEHHVCTVDEKRQWLQEAGFTSIEVPWRFLNLAVISAVKVRGD